MGCRDRDSSYTALVFREEDQRWYAGWSAGAISFEAQDKERVLQKIKQDYSHLSLEDWDLVQLGTGGWKATRKRLVGSESN